MGVVAPGKKNYDPDNYPA